MSSDYAYQHMKYQAKRSRGCEFEPSSGQWSKITENCYVFPENEMAAVGFELAILDLLDQRANQCGHGGFMKIAFKDVL